MASPAERAAERYASILRNDCPHLANALYHATSVVRALKSAFHAGRTIASAFSSRSHQQQYELAARFGTVCAAGAAGSSCFQPGVSAGFMARALAAAETARVWVDVSPWTQSVDWVYSTDGDKPVCSSTTSVASSEDDMAALHDAEDGADAAASSCSDADEEAADGKHGQNASSSDSDDDDDDDDEAGTDPTYTLRGFRPRAPTGGRGRNDTRFAAAPAAAREAPRAPLRPGKPREISVSHTSRTEIAAVALRWTAKTNGNFALLGTGAGETPAVQLSTSALEKVPVSKLPARVDTPAEVVIRQTRTFWYRGSCGTTGSGSAATDARWALHFTLQWRSKSYLESLAALRDNVVPVYDIQIECLRPLEMLRRHNMHCVAIALNVLYKVSDIFAQQVQERDQRFVFLQHMLQPVELDDAESENRDTDSARLPPRRRRPDSLTPDE